MRGPWSPLLLAMGFYTLIRPLEGEACLWYLSILFGIIFFTLSGPKTPFVVPPTPWLMMLFLDSLLAFNCML